MTSKLPPSRIRRRAPAFGPGVPVCWVQRGASHFTGLSSVCTLTPGCGGAQGRGGVSPASILKDSAQWTISTSCPRRASARER